MNTRFPPWLAPVIGGLVFLLTGLALIPYPGLQNDELFFSGPIYAADAAFFSIQMGARKIPFMVMSYSGALKTWLYAALFNFFAADQWSVRLPVLLMGVCTIWLTWTWMRRLVGTRAAAVTVALLSTDTLFLITNTFDWGPVALQHLLLMAGIVAIQRWLTTDATRYLILGAAFWGLGLWDKALLIWPIVGLGLASFLLYPREVLKRLRATTVVIGLASFLLAAAPLVWYNVARPGETATQNARFTLAELPGKQIVLQQTINGSSLYDYMIARDSDGFQRSPRTSVERISVRLAHLAGNHPTNWMPAAWLIGFVLALLSWRSRHFRLVAFLLVATFLTWVQMALTKGAGGATHHTILLWPFPAVILGIVFTETAARIPRIGTAILWTAVGILSLQNLLTTNQYLSRFIVNGPAGGWTDAIYPLASSIDHKSVSWYGLVDWGYLNGLRLLHEGDLPMFIALVPPEGANPSEEDKRELQRQIGSGDFLFIQHTDDKQMFPGVNDRFRKATAALGYHEVVERTVADRNGRPVFELFRFAKEGT